MLARALRCTGDTDTCRARCSRGPSTPLQTSPLAGSVGVPPRCLLYVRNGLGYVADIQYIQAKGKWSSFFLDLTCHTRGGTNSPPPK
jgi:hypothetical protein